MDKVEKVARAMAQSDGRPPDEPLKGWRRIIGKSVAPFSTERNPPAWNHYVPFATMLIAGVQALDDK